MAEKRRMKPLTPRGRRVAEENFTKAFCATLPSARDVSAASKAFCATLPSELDPTEIAAQAAKAFCATLPSNAQLQEQLSKVLKSVVEQSE